MPEKITPEATKKGKTLAGTQFSSRAVSWVTAHETGRLT